MVTTLSPNVSDTPTRPMPTCGKVAAITALPHPANVSQNVPINSAAYFFVSIRVPPVSSPPLGNKISPKSSEFLNGVVEVDEFHWIFGPFIGPEIELQRWTFGLLSDTSAPSRLKGMAFVGPWF